LVWARAGAAATDEAAATAAERRKLRRSIGVSSYAGFSGRAEINATEAAEQGHRGIFFLGVQEHFLPCERSPASASAAE
jgi:hypothetical protein